MQDPLTLSTTLLAAAIRRQVFEHTIRHNGGYLSQACSAAEILATMYGEVLQLGPSVAPAVPRPFAGTPSADNPHSFTGAGYHGAFEPDKDRFFISPAHYALVVYSALVVLGRQDAATPPDWTRRMAAGLPRHQLLELDSAHLSNVEAAPAFNAAVLDFLG